MTPGLTKQEYIEYAAKAAKGAYVGLRGFDDGLAVLPPEDLSCSELPHIQAYGVCPCPGVRVVAVRGTDERADWGQNLDLAWEDDDESDGRIHHGFSEAAVALWVATVHDFIRRSGATTIIFTGHSLGGAVATLLACLALRARTLNFGVHWSRPYLITFGSPRVGDGRWAKWMDHYLQDRVIRFVNNNDVVPHIPSRLRGYRHVGKRPCYFGERGLLTIGPTLWHTFWEGLKGMACDLGTPGLDAISDHFMDEYYKRVMRAPLPGTKRSDLPADQPEHEEIEW